MTGATLQELVGKRCDVEFPLDLNGCRPFPLSAPILFVKGVDLPLIKLGYEFEDRDDDKWVNVSLIHSIRALA